MWLLKLTDGSEEVDMLSDKYMLEDGGLIIALPEAKEVWGGNSVYANGAQLILSTYDNREATIMLSIYGETRDTLLFNVARVDRLLQAAKQRSMDEAGPRVELQYAWDGNSQTTYYEVISGKLQWPDNVMSVEQVHQQESGQYYLQNFTLTLTLAPFAYSISPATGTPVSVTVANRSGSGASRSVFNHNDSGHDNYIEIDGDYLLGSFPMPVSLNMQSKGGHAEKVSKVYIGVRKGDQTFRAFLEDNDPNVYRKGMVTPTTDATSSGGTYSSVSFTETVETTLFRWPLSDAEAEATQGPFRIFGRVAHTKFWDPNANYCLAVSTADGVILHKTEWRTPLNSTTTLFDFGTVFLPPWLGSMKGLAGCNIELRGMRKLAGTTTLALDYLALLPQDGGYRVLEFRGVKDDQSKAGMAQNEYLVDDGWSYAVYQMTTGGKKIGTPFGLMPTIKLQPGLTQRLYFLMEGASGSSEINRELLVSVGVVPTYMVLA